MKFRDVCNHIEYCVIQNPMNTTRDVKHPTLVAYQVMLTYDSVLVDSFSGKKWLGLEKVGVRTWMKIICSWPGSTWLRVVMILKIRVRVILNECLLNFWIENLSGIFSYSISIGRTYLHLAVVFFNARVSTRGSNCHSRRLCESLLDIVSKTFLRIVLIEYASFVRIGV